MEHCTETRDPGRFVRLVSTLHTGTKTTVKRRLLEPFEVGNVKKACILAPILHDFSFCGLI